ncbi:MAG: nucleotidyltransferase family protein [Chloroflexota bacterium]|nr:nucleotidyltransferase family protein [Chloroflexota bacterium]MDE2685422.1 nucleotidyltransferase family protein [Chloroflexota bacterium]
MPARIHIPREEIAEICRRYRVHRLALFGSVIRDDFTPQSDVDVLVQYEPGHAGGFEFFRMRRELIALLGREVDMHTAASLSPYFRQEVLDEAEEIYVAS